MGKPFQYQSHLSSLRVCDRQKGAMQRDLLHVQNVVMQETKQSSDVIKKPGNLIVKLTCNEGCV